VLQIYIGLLSIFVLPYLVTFDDISYKCTFLFKLYLIWIIQGDRTRKGKDISFLCYNLCLAGKDTKPSTSVPTNAKVPCVKEVRCVGICISKKYDYQILCYLDAIIGNLFQMDKQICHCHFWNIHLYIS
jgi:hypothetical protein